MKFNTQISKTIIKGMQLVIEDMEKEGLLTDETTLEEVGEFAASREDTEVIVRSVYL